MSLTVYRSKKTRLYHWRATARNGRILADSGEGYKRKRDCEHGMRLTGRMLCRDQLGKLP